jgi:hypothetical protein
MFQTKKGHEPIKMPSYSTTASLIRVQLEQISKSIKPNYDVNIALQHIYGNSTL